MFSSYFLSWDVILWPWDIWLFRRPKKLSIKTLETYYHMFFSFYPVAHSITLRQTRGLCLYCTAVVDDNYDDNGTPASITLPTADGIKCDYPSPFFEWQMMAVPVQLSVLSLVYTALSIVLDGSIILMYFIPLEQSLVQLIYARIMLVFRKKAEGLLCLMRPTINIHPYLLDGQEHTRF